MCKQIITNKCAIKQKCNGTLKNNKVRIMIKHLQCAMVIK